MSDNVTIVFVAITIVGTVMLWWKRKGVSMTSNFPSTIGVLGTFVGIFIGLMDFDVQDIQGSVPELLGGLKTAFITSIVGMFCSMVVKLWYKPDVDEVYTSPEFEQGTEIKKELSYLVELMKDVRRILSEDKTSSNIAVLQDAMEKSFKDLDISNRALVNDVKSCIGDGVKDLGESINEFGRIVAEQSSKELIESIQRVMDDFNAKINDQLGENFKELSVSINNLNTWQKEHVELLATMKDYEGKMIEFVQKTVCLMDEFNENCELYKKNEENLNESIRVLVMLIERVAEVGKDFENVMPTIETRMNKAIDVLANLTNKYESMAQSAINSLTEGQQTIRTNNAALRNDINDIHSRMNDAMQQFSSHLVGVLQKFYEDLNAVNRRIR